MIKRLKTYWQVWLIQAKNAWSQTFINRGTNILFMLGKFLRLGMMLLVLFTVKRNIDSFGGYTPNQMIMFFLVYQFVDVLAQVVFRGVYSFQQKIREGDFDFLMSQPINPLFQSLTWHPDINDALFIIPSTLLSVFIVLQLQIEVTLASFVLFLALLINSFMIAAAFHIIVLVFGILTMEVDGVVWLYRDLNQFGRFPITIYREPMRTALFFIIPIGMMITIPAEVLLNLQPTYTIAVAFGVGIGLLLLSLWLWHWALKQYSSASS